MDRRELFKTLAGAAAVAGVSTTVSAYEAPGIVPPALFVFETAYQISAEPAARIVAAWTAAIADTPFAGVKAIVLAEGMTLHALAADGTILNREQVKP